MVVDDVGEGLAGFGGVPLRLIRATELHQDSVLGQSCVLLRGKFLPRGDRGIDLPCLHLTLKTSTNEEYRLQATVIQQDLARVGIDLEVRSYEFATMYADVLKGNFQMFTLQWVGGAMVDPDILRRVFYSTQTPENGGFNRGHYSNPEVDRLIDLAGAATGESELKKYYGEAQKLIAQDAPYISLWNRTNIAVARDTLSGLHINTVGNFESLKDAMKN